MPGWMKHKLESRLPAENINNLRYADERYVDKCEEESEKAGTKLNIQKTKIGVNPKMTEE